MKSNKINISVLNIILEIVAVILLFVLVITFINISSSYKYDDNLMINTHRNDAASELKDVSNYSFIEDEKLYNDFIYNIKNSTSDIVLDIVFDDDKNAKNFLNELLHTKDFYFSNGFDAYIYSPLFDGEYRIKINAKTALEAYNLNIENKKRLDDISAEIISDNLTPSGILKVINKYIVDNIDYDINYTTLEDALNGKVRCSGYASLFKALAEINGIKTDIVVGKMIENDGGHAWVVSYPYDIPVYFDPTYNEDSFWGNKYSFLNKEEILKDRVELFTTTYLLKDGYYNPAMDYKK